MQHKLKLQFPDEATAIEALSDYHTVDDEGNGIWITGSHTHALLPIGNETIPAEYDENENEIAPAIPLDGWRVHLQLETPIPSEIEQYIINPNYSLIEWAEIDPDN